MDLLLAKSMKKVFIQCRSLMKALLLLMILIVNLVDADDNIVVSESVESLAAQTSADIKLHFTPSVHQRGSLLTFTGKIESVTDEDLSDNVTGPVSTANKRL